MAASADLGPHSHPHAPHAHHSPAHNSYSAPANWFAQTVQSYTDSSHCNTGAVLGQGIHICIF